MGTPLEPREEQVEEVLDRLYEEYPDSTISLNYSNRLELLIAVILSAQCTDERVNKVCADLFETYETPEDYANAPQEELAEAINSITYYNNKAKYIRSACADIAEQHDGEVPDTMSELTELAGVVARPPTSCSSTATTSWRGSSSTPTSSGSPAGSRSRKRRARRRSNRTSSTWFPRRTGSSSRIS